MADGGRAGIAALGGGAAVPGEDGCVWDGGGGCSAAGFGLRRFTTPVSGGACASVHPSMRDACCEASRGSEAARAAPAAIITTNESNENTVRRICLPARRSIREYAVRKLAIATGRAKLVMPDKKRSVSRIKARRRLPHVPVATVTSARPAFPTAIV
jgi:mRNA-degrading endonuclease toxin of MazEF toxin-antitoxin module